MQAKAYWLSSFNRRCYSLTQMVVKWEPPPAGWLKFNVDAALRRDTSWSACILRDHLGRVQGAWVSRNSGSDVFSAELKAFLLAFQAGDDLQS